MISTWQHTLETHGATLVDGHVADFGDPDAERRQAAHGPIVADLSHLNLIQFAGEDAPSFLQGQLSNDVHLLDGKNAQYTSYNSPKGRMLANGLLWQSLPGHYVLQLPAQDSPSRLRFHRPQRFYIYIAVGHSFSAHAWFAEYALLCRIAA